MNENILTNNGRNKIHSKGHKATLMARDGTRSAPG